MPSPDDTSRIRRFTEAESTLDAGDSRECDVESTDPHVWAWHIGDRIRGRYHLERPLGRGAMGDVYLADDEILDKRVALKVLRRDLAKDSPTVERFLREVALAQAITHPHVVRIFDIGEFENHPYFSMEYLQGQTLDEAMAAEGPRLSVREICDIAIDVLSGLDAIHRAGVVHRDLKPSNIMLTRRGAVLMDFGVAGLDRVRPASVETARTGNGVPTRGLAPLPVTEFGTIVGSPAYMAPELWEEGVATTAADLFAFGVVLYQLLTGRLPYDCTDTGVAQYVERIRVAAPQASASLGSEVPSRLKTLIGRCLAPDPWDRPNSARAALRLLSPWYHRRNRGHRMVAPVLGLLAISVGAAGMWASAVPTTSAHQLGLPDEVAALDLSAAVRAYDVGDYRAALTQLDRLASRSGEAAAIIFWRATMWRELGNEEMRREACALPPAFGTPTWQALAESACGRQWEIGPSLRKLGDGELTDVDSSLLPIAISMHVLPQLDAAGSTRAVVEPIAKSTLERLSKSPDWSATRFALPVRWELAAVALQLTLGEVDAARARLDVLAATFPRAPAVLSERARWAAMAGQTRHAHHLAAAAAPDDPRAQIRLWLAAGELERAGTFVDGLVDHPVHASALATWCGYAYRFELPNPPARCYELQPGLVRRLWSVWGGESSDFAAMNAAERVVWEAQSRLNRGVCGQAFAGKTTVLQPSVTDPFSSYRWQLEIGSALCGLSDPKMRERASMLARKLLDTAPADPWVRLLAAQVDAELGSHAAAHRARREVATSWMTADPGLPLVTRLQAIVDMRPEAAASQPLSLTPSH